MKVKINYNVVIIMLAILSVSLVVLDILSVVNLNTSPIKEIDIIILLVFTGDYIGRFYLSKNKVSFFKYNFFDLIAIIPFHSVFAVFRLTRLLRITRLSRLTRIVGIIGRFTKHIKVFFQTNGFLYMIYISGVIMLIGATLYSVVENINFIDSLWWAFVTSTTVGYGDIVPATNIGRLTAIVLMLTGIGIFGALTSTITSFFMNDNDEKIESQSNEIKELNIKITQLLEKMDRNEIG